MGSKWTPYHRIWVESPERRQKITRTSTPILQSTSNARNLPSNLLCSCQLFCNAPLDNQLKNYEERNERKSRFLENSLLSLCLLIESHALQVVTKWEELRTINRGSSNAQIYHAHLRLLSSQIVGTHFRSQDISRINLILINL